MENEGGGELLLQETEEVETMGLSLGMPILGTDKDDSRRKSSVTPLQP